MKQKLYIRSWLLVLLSLMAITSKAQTVNISGYSPYGTEDGFPLFNVDPGIITITSSSGSFYYIFIDDVQFAYNSSSYWSSYDLDVTPFADGKNHKLQLRFGNNNRGICYFKVLDESNLKDGFYFSINGENATVISVLSDIESAIIPDTFVKDGISYPVTQIGDNAFYGKTNLSLISIPNTVTSIGNSAFYGCSALTSVNMPESIIKIGVQAFNGCTALKELTFSDSKNSVELGYNNYNSSGTGKGLFADCPIETLYVGRPYTITDYSSSYTYTSYPQRYGYSPFPSTISTLTIGDKVTSIPEYFLYNGSQIESLTIPNSVTSIGNSAFYGCSALTSVNIPESIVKIGVQAFNGCTALKELTFSDSENSVELGYNNYSSSGTGKGLFADCPIETLYVGRPYTITNYSSSYTYTSYPQRYGYSPFPSTISTLTIGNNVTSIPAYFLYNGSRIESLDIPNSVTSIGNSAFYRCSGLISVTLPQGVTSIGTEAFSGCSALASVTIPQSVTSIGNYAFSGTGLTILEFNAQNCNICGSLNYPAFPSTISILTIGDKVTSIPDYFLYKGSQIESLTIPNSVTYIGYGAFLNSNSNLKSLTIGSGLLKIGNYAFSTRNSSSYQYTIPKVFWMGNTPPEGYNNIKASVNYVSNDQYSLSNQLQYQFLSSRFTVDGTIYVPVSPSERTCDVVDCEYSEDYADIQVKDKVTNKGLEITVLNINQYSFYNNNYIQSLNISSIGEIGDYAFTDCDNLESLQITNNGNIGSQAFYGCDNLQTATIQNNGSIGSQAFYGLTKLNSAVLGNNVTAILSECFYGCSALQQFTIPNSVIEVGTSAFKNCSSLETVNIGTGVPTLPTSVFSGCSSLSSLIIPNNIKAIRDYAFSGCKSLGDITIEDAEERDEEEPTVQSFPNWTSTNHSHSSISKEEYTFNVHPGNVLTFNYSVSSESGYDYLIVKLDGSEIVKESGSKSGSYRNVFETAKNVTLYMAYSKDRSNSDGSDNASVTDILLTNKVGNIDYLTLGSNGSDPLFSDCPLDEVYIGRKLLYQTSSSYGYSPFYRNTSLRTVEITDAETQIYDNEFYGCTNLSFLKIGNGVKTIGNWAFSGCSSLDYFSAGFMVESIGKEAFSDCTGLTKYYSYSIVPPVCGDQALDDINKWECTLYVPDESSDEYQAAPQWKDFFFIEEMDAVLVAEIRLNLTEVTLAPTNTVQLTAQAFPSNATDKSLIWTSSNSSIAWVTSDGLVTGISDGEAIITVKSADGNAEATCIVRVDSAYDGIESIYNDSQGSIEVYNMNGYKVSDSTENLAPGIYIVRQGSKAYKISVK